MKGIPLGQEVKDKIIKLAEMGYDRVSVAEKLCISTRTVSKYAGGIFVSNEMKSKGIKTYAIPKEVWEEWDMVTKSLRKYFCKSKV